MFVCTLIYPNNQTGPMIRPIMNLRFLIQEPPLFWVPPLETAHRLRTMRFNPPPFNGSFLINEQRL